MSAIHKHIAYNTGKWTSYESDRTTADFPVTLSCIIPTSYIHCFYDQEKTRSTEKKKRFEEVHPNRGPQSCGLCRAGEGWAGQRLRQAG